MEADSSARRSDRGTGKASAAVSDGWFPEPPPLSNRAVYVRFLPYLRPYWKRLLAVAVLLLANVAMGLLEPWPVKFLFDSVIAHHPVHGALGAIVHRLVGDSRYALLDLIIAGFVVIEILSGIFSYGNSWFLSSVGQRFVWDIRRELFAHVQRMSLRFHGEWRTGDLMLRISGDIGSIQDMVVNTTSTVFGSTLSIALMIVVMLRLDWRYTLAILLVAPFLYMTARYYRRAIKYSTRQGRRREGNVGSIVQEVISSIRVVKAFTREEYEQQRFEEQGGASLAANLRTAKLQAQFAPAIGFIGALGTVVVLWFGVREVLDGHLTAGELLVFVAYYESMFSPIRQLARVSVTTARGLASAERVVEILDVQPDLDDLPGARPAPRFQGKVSFEAVSFGYVPERLALRDVSFEVEPGSIAALVGATGSGKTTLISMIPRFYDPTQGVVRIDDQDIRDFTLKSLRSQIALVLQEPVLFRTSLYDNIAYGHPDATADEIERAAEAANVTEFLDRLPKGYETVLGERGASLSGGERQRVAIARAIVRNAPILLLDEPTTGLDVETEGLVLEAMRRLMAGRTTFVIAHHLSTIQSADVIMVLKGGQIIERGTHDELLGQSGTYTRLYTMQVSNLHGLSQERPSVAPRR